MLNKLDCWIASFNPNMSRTRNVSLTYLQQEKLRKTEKTKTYLDPPEIWNHRTRRDRWLYPDGWAKIYLHETEATRGINSVKYIKGNFERLEAKFRLA